MTKRFAWTARILFVLSLLLYVLTLSTGFYVGQSASVVAQHLGVQPFPPMLNHVWGWIIRALAALPIGPMAVRIHLFGALCSAASVWLLFHIMVRIEYARKFSEGMPRASLQRVRLFSAIVACLTLATAIPFWMVATRAHPLAFDLMLLLFSFHLLLRYRENGRASYINSAVLIYGVGLTDFATLVLFLPVFGVMVLVALYNRQELRASVVFRLLGLALVGLAPQFIAAALYAKSDAFVWRQFTHYGEVLWWMWHDQYTLVLRSLPRVGWLTVGVVSIVPWLAVYVMGVGRRSVSAGAWLSTGLLAGLLSVLAGVILLNKLISPWAITKDMPLLVTPYVVIAMWVGSIAGYWLALFQRAGRGFWHAVGFGYAALVLVGVVSLVAINASTATGRPGRWFTAFADQTLERLNGREVVLSAGSFDDILLLRARERGIPLKMINLRSAQQLPYRRYVASLFPDDTRLRSLAEIGVTPLIGEWFAKETNIASRVAVLDVADLWMAATLMAEPHGLLYFGRTPNATGDVETVAADNHAFWKTFAEPLSDHLPPEENPAFGGLRSIRAQAAKSANNLGVFYEDAGRADLAEESYAEAHRLDEKNVSALVNLHALYQRANRPEAKEVESKIDDLISRDQMRSALWSLSYYYGVIRSPELYARRGWAWAMSGKPALASQDLRQALDLAGESTVLRMALASIDSDDGSETPEEVLQEELLRRPDNIEAAMGLYRIAARRGQFEMARARLDNVKAMKGAPTEMIEVEDALLEALTGHLDQAIAQLGAIVRNRPSELRAWAALAVVAGQQNDTKMIQEALDHLQRARGASPSIQFLAAQLAVRQGDRDGAKQLLDQVLRQEPRHAPALALMVQLLLAQGDRESAERLVERLVSVDSQNPFGNYMLGTFQALRGQYALAESSLRVALVRERAPAALNDLAYVLARQGQYEEALSLIQEALQSDGAKGVAESTYGMILLALNRLDEAETALHEAASVNPESVEVQFNLAQLYERKGQKDAALKLAESIASRSGELLRDDQDALRDLLRRLRGGS